MFKWIPFALVRIAFFYVVGILFSIYFGNLISSETILQISVFGSVSYFLLWFFLKKRTFLRYNLMLSIVGFTVISSLGALNLKFSQESSRADHLLNFDQISTYRAHVIEPKYETAKTYRYLLSVDAIKDNKWKPASGKVYLYVNKGFKEYLELGDQLLIDGSPNVLQEPMNPGEFNYKRFLSFKNIYHQDYSTGESIVKIGSKEMNWFVLMSNTIRKWSSEKLKQAIPKEREQTIALALILGVKDGITDEIKNAYSASGAMHVLAVSGLHVGIIYAIVLLIFGRLQKRQYSRWLLGVITLCLLWLYAAVTGFSPSVLRAVTMFSFIAIAKASGRNTNIYNTIAGSGLVLLVVDPYLIMSVGFQLSYLAVLGIIYLQPKIYGLIISDNVLIDKIWTITSVSIAAQLATFSLGLLYFHQFPTFFLLSNLVVIPGAFLILAGGLLLLGVSFSSFLFQLVGSVLTGLIFWINEGVFWIQSLPNSLIEGIYINTFQTWLIIVAILASFLLFEFRRRRFLYITAFSILCLVFFRFDWLNETVNSERITIYRVNNHLAIDLLSKGKSVLITDSTLWENKDRMRFHVIPNQLQLGIDDKQLSVLSTDKPFNVLSWGEIDILAITDDITHWSWEANTTFDYVLLSKNFQGSLSEISNKVKYKQIILDGSLKGYVANRLWDEAQESSNEVYSVYHNGSKTINL